MGYSLCWIAIRGKPREDVFRELRIRPTGARESLPESPLTCAALGDWTLLMANGDTTLVEEPTVRALSAGGELVSCFVEEHVMVSDASGWRGGEEIWRVTHEAEQGLEHLDAIGTPPAAFAAILERLTAELRNGGGADFLFDVPIELAKAETGFRHDEDLPGADGEPFEVFESGTPAKGAPKRSWLQRLLGRGG